MLERRKVDSYEDAERIESRLDEVGARLAGRRGVMALAVLGPRKDGIPAAKGAFAPSEVLLTLARSALEEPPNSAGLWRDSDPAVNCSPVYTMALIDPSQDRTDMPETQLGKLRRV